MLGNANNLVAFRTRDAKTQEFIVETIGKTSVKTIAESQSTGAVHGDNLLAHSGGYGERLVEEETEVFSPELLGQLPDLQYIASISGGRVVKGRIELLTMHEPPRLEDQFWLTQAQ